MKVDMECTACDAKVTTTSLDELREWDRSHGQRCADSVRPEGIEPPTTPV